MLIKNLIDEDFVNYKKPSMFIGFSKCDFKCDKECGKNVCQNSALAAAPSYNIWSTDIVERYLKNPITEAVVISGLEPFDKWQEIQEFIVNFRYYSPDDVVIYTGYYPEEIKEQLKWLSLYDPIIVKFGRYIPDDELHLDNILGVTLASKNQFATKINYEDFC